MLYPVELRALCKSTGYSANRNFSGRRSGPTQTESEVRADYIGVSRYLKRRMAVRLFLAGGGCIAGHLILDGELQFCERMIPLLGDRFQ